MSIDAAVPPNPSDEAAAQLDDVSMMDVSSPEKQADKPVAPETETNGLTNGSESANTNHASTGSNDEAAQALAAPTRELPEPAAAATEANGTMELPEPAAAEVKSTREIPAAADANGTREIPLAGETIMEEELRPAKKQKQAETTPSMDVSPDTSSASGAMSVSPNKDDNQPTVDADAASTDDANQPPTVDADAASTDAASTDNDANADSGTIHHSVAEVIKLEDIPDSVQPLESLTLRDMAELESALQIGETHNYDDDDGWKSDWNGNLLLSQKEVIVNKGYLADQPNAKPVRIMYCDWVASNAPGGNGLRGLELLFRFVYNMKGTPDMAKKILAFTLQRPAETAEQRLEYIIEAVKRVSYDPAVLQQDGWTTKKVDTPEEGEAFHIGRRIMWQRHEAIVVAYTTDETYGGLWKAAYVEDLETFE